MQRQPEQRARAHELHGNGASPSTGNSMRSSAAPDRSSFSQPRSRIIIVESRDARRHGDGIAGERAGLVRVAIRREMLHDLARAAKAADGHAAADHFAECGQIGQDAGQLRDAAARQAEAGDHFIEYQQCAVLARDVAQRLQILLPLQQQAVVRRHRLDDHRRDARAFAREQIAQRGFVIQRQDARAGDECLRHAGRRRLPKVASPEPAAPAGDPRARGSSRRTSR